MRRGGPWKTLHERLRVWTKDGTWEQILDRVIVKDDSVGVVGWTFPVDSTNVRPTTMRREPGKKGSKTGWIEGLAVADEPLGRSRGCLTSKSTSRSTGVGCR
ncbi:hypothetical protein GCM10010102_08330 [Promicromonospora citrea]|uniref:Uncharacterized protein n=1 Tax=Promicromonospora citrea TaxID=43677 RepID=A0A8H9GF98_9MICO|nr:hypothetical protein GCM10010102_08330 [Promicromonospora citrea]